MSLSLLGYMLEKSLAEIQSPREAQTSGLSKPKDSDKETSLYCNVGSSDKVYFVRITCDDDSPHCGPNRYNVDVKWGRRGGTLQSMRKASDVSWAIARNVYSTIIQEKINKGYKVSV